MTRAIALVLCFLVVGGCARTTAPPGGDVPETPLQVLATSPDTFAVVEPFSGHVEILFDRRVSERPATGQLRDAVIVSPRTGEVSVQHRRRGLRISMEGGFTGSTIYRITVRPTVQDLFRNELADDFDLFFSTGPEFEPNVLAGMVTDRITGEEVPEVRVDARPYQGGPHHSTVADASGIFTFPYLPQGRYWLVAYEDQNRSREPDFTEPQDSIRVDLFRGDTLVVTELALLQPDTTAAVLEEVTVVDSITLRLTFDDHLDAQEPLDEVVAQLIRPGANAPEVLEILHLHEWEARVAAELEAAEEAAADPDADPPGDPPLPDDPPDDAQEEEPILPSQEIVLLLSRPLLPGIVYEVHVEDIRNIHGLPGGGGVIEIEGPEPPEEPEEDPPDDPPGDDPPGGSPPGEGLEARDVPRSGAGRTAGSR